MAWYNPFSWFGGDDSPNYDSEYSYSEGTGYMDGDTYVLPDLNVVAYDSSKFDYSSQNNYGTDYFQNGLIGHPDYSDAEYLGAYGSSFLNSGIGTAQGLWHATTHPLQTLSGIYDAASHPLQTWDSISSGLSLYGQQIASGDPKALGSATFEGFGLFFPITKIGRAGSFSKAFKGTNKVSTPHGLAHQADTPAARAALEKIQSRATVYRQGSFGVQNTADAQFWALQNPTKTPGFTNKLGMPGSITKPDWIMGGTVNLKKPVITRPAPKIGTNMGGNIEAVVPPNSIDNLWFHMPD